ncbi:MAG: asparagine synthase (glutamine-hydrolyzing) [Epsilonproteobacteria bacterium]|nr:asparagine synthase (glutamine-hydrolyzing) [Campylobacterota bacterium]
MCAIFGVINSDKDIVSNALEIMRHRGREFSGIQSAGGAVFGFNRLAIENINKNLQPLKKGDKLFVFNGEIYNYKSLISRYGLKASTEIETIAGLWEKFGVDFVRLLDGMFAIAVYDKKLYLFKDLFGKKPLYFTQNAFSSEIKALFLLHKKELNTNALSEYFSLNSSLAPNTMYKGVYKLPAGCYYDGEIKRWGDIEAGYKPQNIEIELEELLKKSVIKRFFGEAEVGSLLSGGLDSSLIAAIASDYKKIDTFSVGYVGYENYDEVKYAKIAASHLGLKNYDVRMDSGDFFDSFEDVLYFMDEPIADSSFFAAYFLAKAVDKKVLFSGEGSDELFLGYRRYEEYLGFLKAYLPNKKWLGKYLKRHPEDIKEWEVFRRFFDDEEVFRGINEVFFERQLQKLLKKNHSPVDYKRFYKFDGGFAMSYFDLKVWVGEVLMMKLDKMFMSNTIEVRTPFLDEELVKYVFSLSEKQRGSKKKILKKIAKKYLPKEIISRRKKGFAVPFYEWLKQKGELRRIIDINRKTKLLNEEYLKEIIKTGHKRYKQHIWSLYLFSRWIEKEFL